MQRLILTFMALLIVAGSAYAQVSPTTPLGERLLLNDVTTGSATVQVGSYRGLTMVVEFATGSTAGAVVLEEADLVAYAGSWSLTATATLGTAPEQHIIHYEGKALALRVRVSTTVSGGGDPGVTVTIEEN